MSSPLPVRLQAPDPAVVTRQVHKRYGGSEALRGMNLQVPEGSVYLLVGPNGAGKTTLLRVLLDLARPDAGTAEVFGLDCRARGPEARAQIGYVSERPEWGYGWMTVERLLRHHAVYHPTWDAAYAAWLGSVGIWASLAVAAVLAAVRRPPEAA